MSSNTIRFILVVLIGCCTSPCTELFAQEQKANYELKLKSGLSEYFTLIGISYRNSDAYPGRTYYWHDQLSSDPPRALFLIEFERSINRIQVGVGVGLATNGFSYVDGYLPVGLAVDSLPNELSTRLDYRLLLNTLKVGYRLGDRLSVTPYVGLYNTRLDGVKFETEWWDIEERVVRKESGTTQGDALLVWDSALALEIESLYHISNRMSVGFSVFRSNTIGRPSSLAVAQGVGIRKFFATRYQRQGGTLVLCLKL